jgi:hypothetical protein
MKLLNTIALSAVAAVIATPLAAEAKTRHHHHAANAGAGSSTAAELHEAKEEISQLQARLNALEAKIDQQGSTQQAAASQASSQAEAATQLASSASAKADKAEVKADAATAAVAHPAIPKALAWASNTQINGRMYFNESTITQKTNGAHLANNSSGTGFNVKRMYLGVDHQFSPMFSASVVMDASNVIGETANMNYVTPSTTATAPTCTTTAAVTSQTNPALIYTTSCTPGTASNLGTAGLVGKGFYIKLAYLQAKLDPALVIRVGSANLPWIPYIENQYGFRHIENVAPERLGYGTSADWGVHVLGDLAGGLISYQISAIDGGGYRNVKVTKNIDLEGRLSAQYKGLWAAVGGYTGKRGNDTQVLTGAAFPTTFRTAKRLDAAAGYKNALFSVGGEYYYAKNWNNVTVNPATNAYSQDSAQGYSVFGNYNITPKWTAFGRYDWNQPNRYTDPALRDHYFNVGLQWEPAKVVDIALVYKRETAKNGAVSTTNGVIGCGTSATASSFATSGALASGTCAGNGTYDEVGVFGMFKF